MGFEGEYFNDKEWNGKRYDQEGNIMYELKNGKGIKKFYFSGFDFNSEYNENPTLERLILLSEWEYLNGERNGKGKEYDFNGVLDFEGEYLNDKRNGKGKEYWGDGKLMFEGEYLSNFKIKGKYYINGKLEFEGEFRYNNKWNGKGYDENGNVIYELINGNGKVKEYDDNGILEFEGEYLNGKRNGKGKKYLGNHIISDGEYVND